MAADNWCGLIRLAALSQPRSAHVSGSTPIPEGLAVRIVADLDEIADGIDRLLADDPPAAADLAAHMENREIDKWDSVLPETLACESAGERRLDPVSHPLPIVGGGMNNTKQKRLPGKHRPGQRPAATRRARADAHRAARRTASYTARVPDATEREAAAWRRAHPDGTCRCSTADRVPLAHRRWFMASLRLAALGVTHTPDRPFQLASGGRLGFRGTALVCQAAMGGAPPTSVSSFP